MDQTRPRNVSQLCGPLPSMPATNQLWRCSDEPWVHDSGVTRPCGPLLDAVVADRRRGVERIGDVLPRDVLHESRVERVADPQPGVAVGLELEPHLAALRARVAARAPQRAGQVLDVVPVLVGEDVRLGERAASRAELRLQLVEEAEVDVDVAVARAVERARSPTRQARNPSGCRR